MTTSQRVRLGDVCVQEREVIKPGERPDLRYIGLESIEAETGRFVEGELSKTRKTERNQFRLHQRSRSLRETATVFEQGCVA